MPFVARGNGQPRPGHPGIYSGDHDAASTSVAVGTVDKGDATYMYEIGWQYTHGGYDDFNQPGGPVLSGISLLRLRRHGFMSCKLRTCRRTCALLSAAAVPDADQATGEGGRLLSKPLRLPRCNSSAPRLALTLNCQTSVDGSVNVSLAGTGSSLAAVPFVGNSVAAPVQWLVGGATASSSGTVPGSWQGTVARVHVDMTYSDLYAFQFSCE